MPGPGVRAAADGVHAELRRQLTQELGFLVGQAGRHRRHLAELLNLNEGELPGPVPPHSRRGWREALEGGRTGPRNRGRGTPRPYSTRYDVIVDRLSRRQPARAPVGAGPAGPGPGAAMAPGAPRQRRSA